MQVFYCPSCTWPPEYCEFGKSLDKCKVALNKANPELFSKLYGTEELPDVSSLEIDEKKTEPPKKKGSDKKVTIKREARTRRKSTVSVYGLHFYDVDLKKAAKLFSNKFACGSSVTKNNQGQDEIVVQGDVEYEIEEFILKSFPQIPPAAIANISK